MISKWGKLLLMLYLCHERWERGNVQCYKEQNTTTNNNNTTTNNSSNSNSDTNKTSYDVT